MKHCINMSELNAIGIVQNHNEISSETTSGEEALPALFLNISTAKKRRTHWGTLRAGLLLTIAVKGTTTRPSSSSVIDVAELEQERHLHLNTISRFVQQKDVISLRKFGGVERVASVLGSSLQTGINDHGVEFETIPVHAKGYTFFLVKAATNLTAALLLVSAGLSFFVELNEQGLTSGWHDGLAIIAALIMILTFNSLADFRQAKKEEKMLWEMRNKLEYFNVVRRGNYVHTPISQIVVGDILHLREGDRVPADGLFIHGEGLLLDEGSNPKIDADMCPFLSAGSRVIQGSGVMIVTSISLNCLHTIKKTLVEIWIDKVTKFMDDLALGVSVIIAFVVFIEVLSKKHRNDDNIIPELKGTFRASFLVKVFHSTFMRPRGTISILAGSVTVFVIGFQHGMPLVITISLTFWKQKFEDNQASAQNLSACAMVGVVTVLCVNATGGILCKEVEINNFLIDDKDMITDQNSETHHVVLEALQQGICLSNFLPEIYVGSIDRCLVSWAGSRWGMDHVELVGRSFSILDYKKLSSNDEGRGVLVCKIGDEEEDINIMYCHWTGDASTILGMCSHYFDFTGQCHGIGNQKDKFEKGIKDMENKGLRPIALACIKTETAVIEENGLHLLALVGLRYPCLEEMKSALETLKNESISIKLVSEDYLSVARAIAIELGIYHPAGSNNMLCEGESFRLLDDDAKMEKIDEIVVMGRSRPADTLLLVKCLKEKGDIVAFFGGSTITDIPILREADVAISEMVRDQSDIIILSKNSFTSILKLSKFVYQNIRTFIQLQLTTCISGLLVSSIVTIVPRQSPITTVQLFWVNGIMCLLGVFMMVMELKLPERPTNRNQSLITEAMWTNIIVRVICQASVSLTFQFSGNYIPGMNDDVKLAMMFNIFSLMQVFNQLNAMELRRQLKKEVVLRQVVVNSCFLMAVCVFVTLQLLVVQFMGSLAGCEKLNCLQWIICVCIAAFSLGLDYVVNFTAILMWGSSMIRFLRLKLRLLFTHNVHILEQYIRIKVESVCRLYN